MVEPSLESEGPLTLLVSRPVAADCREVFEKILRRMVKHSLVFEGHRGVHVTMPEGAGRAEILFSFEHRQQYEAWRAHADTVTLLAELESVTDGQAVAHVYSGMETWAPGGDVMPRPRAWKMFLVTWMALYPVVLVLTWLMRPVLRPLPRLVAPLIVTGCAVALMTFAVMPVLVRRFRTWLVR